MEKKPKKKPEEDYQQIARRILDAVVPDAEKPAKEPETDLKAAQHDNRTCR